jgi:hypothetical protein
VDYRELIGKGRINNPHQKSTFIYKRKVARVGFVELAKYLSGRTHGQGFVNPIPFHYVLLPL